ncbi:MAG: queuosine precursor transporter [Halanaeroarchaeum sp.]
MTDRLGTAQVALVGLFVTALITAQLTASKVLAIGIPVSLPSAGDTLFLPGAALAYALTFFATDAYSELYGRRPAQVVVNVGFFLNFVMLALVWSTIALPVAPTSPVDAAAFASVLGPSTSIVVGSLAAYLVSQNLDVVVFHALRERTAGAHLWLRNIASTATSQFVDTVIFVAMAFYAVPAAIGTSQPLPPSVLVGLIVGQYVLKLAIALLDTPFVYLIVGLARGTDRSDVERSLSD